MAVTELAILRLPHTSTATPAVTPRLLHLLCTAKRAMENSSGFPFYYYHCIEDPDIVYILGSWPSVTYHMETFVPSEENQDLLKLLEGLLTVEDMFHIDVDRTVTPLPTDAKLLAIRRHFVRGGERREEREEISQSLGVSLDASADGENVVGGWRLDGLRQGKGEFVQFAGCEGVEKHDGSAGMESNTCYARIREFVETIEVRHAKLLEVDGRT